jgi:hypothetical protein
LNEPTNKKSETYSQIKQITSDYIRTIKTTL